MRILTVLAAALAALLTGCAGISTSDIEAVDRGVFVPSGRVAIDISRHGDSPSHPHTGHAVEIGVTGGEGSDKQEIGAGSDPVVFGGRTFNAPVELKHDFEFRFAEVVYRYRHFFGKGSFGIEALGGLGYAQLDMTVASPLQTTSEKLSSGGLVGAFGVVWSFLPGTSLQSRLTLFASGQNEDVTSALRFDAYIVQAIGRHAAARAGIVSWAVRSNRDADEDFSSGKSPINVRFSGPALGFELMF